MANALCPERSTRGAGGKGSGVGWRQKVENWPNGQAMKGWTRLAKNVHLILHSRKLLRILISGEL